MSPQFATRVDDSAGLFRRLAALVYDAMLLTGVLFAATLILLPFRKGAAFGPHDPFFTVYLLAVAFVFFGWFWTHGGQTLGMRTWRIRVVTLDGTPVTWRRAAARFAVALLSVGLFGLGYVWILFEPRKRSWHDLAAGTRVVKVVPSS